MLAIHRVPRQGYTLITLGTLFRSNLMTTYELGIVTLIVQMKTQALPGASRGQESPATGWTSYHIASTHLLEGADLRPLWQVTDRQPAIVIVS